MYFLIGMGSAVAFLYLGHEWMAWTSIALGVLGQTCRLAVQAGDDFKGKK